MTAEEIAAGLTEAQRNALLNMWRKAEEAGEAHIDLYTHARCRAALQGKGLVEAPIYSTRLTPLGLAVRAAIMKGEQHD